MEEWTFTCDCGRRHAASEVREQARLQAELESLAQARVSAIRKSIWRRQADRATFNRLKLTYG